jgi:hypothetical protein
MFELTFTTFTGALLDQGQTLFFPSLQERDANPIQPEQANTEDSARRLTLVAGDGVKLSGEMVGLTLYAQVDLIQFRAVRNSLRERNLADRPIRIVAEVGEDRALLALAVDGQALR